MSSSRIDGEARHEEPETADDDALARPATDSDAPVQQVDLEAADEPSTTRCRPLHEKPVIPSKDDDGGVENDEPRSQVASDPELHALGGSVAVLRERARAVPPQPRRTTFEVLEIDVTYDYSDGDDDLHLTEYELEQQHQHEEEDRQLLSSSESSADGRATSSAGGGPCERTSADGGHPGPSIPAQCLHACARLVLKEERSAKPMRVGNVSIFAPSCWYRTGWGMLGPHWFGPLIVAVIAASSGWFFFHEALRDIGTMSAAACAIFTFATLYHLANVSLRDPGVVNTRRYQARMASVAREAPSPTNDVSRSDNDDPGSPSSDSPASPEAVPSPPTRRRRERWCDYCQASQPPDGAHCLDCGVCVAGYDHHCVWMGTCIGKGNMRQFVRFNLCWLAFLGYAIVWVSILGPKLF